MTCYCSQATVPCAADVHQSCFRVVTCTANRTGYTCEWHRLVTFPRGVRLRELKGVPKGVCFAGMSAVLAATVVLPCSNNCAKAFSSCDQERQEKHSKCAPDSGRRPVHNNTSTMHQHQIGDQEQDQEKTRKLTADVWL